MNGKKSLSEKYIKILECWSSGIKSPKEIAKVTGLNYNTVCVYLKRLRDRGILTPMPATTAIRIRAEHVLSVLDRVLAEYTLSYTIKRDLLNKARDDVRRIRDLAMELEKYLTVMKIET